MITALLNVIFNVLNILLTYITFIVYFSISPPVLFGVPVLSNNTNDILNIEMCSWFVMTFLILVDYK